MMFLATKIKVWEEKEESGRIKGKNPWKFFRRQENLHDYLRKSP
jgi:hypothetical protein